MKPGEDLPATEAGAADEYESALASLVTDPSPAAMNRFITKLDGEPDDALARTAVRSVCCGPVFRCFDAQIRAVRQKHPEASEMRPEMEPGLAELPVALLPKGAHEALGSATEPTEAWSRVVRLSPDTAFKQRVKHPDLSVTDYGRLPTLVEHGTTIRHPSRRSLSFFGKFHGRWYKTVVKRTEEDEIYLVTFHKSHTRNLRSEQKRGVLVRDAR